MFLPLASLVLALKRRQTEDPALAVTVSKWPNLVVALKAWQSAVWPAGLSMNALASEFPYRNAAQENGIEL